MGPDFTWSVGIINILYLNPVLQIRKPKISLISVRSPVRDVSDLLAGFRVKTDLASSLWVCDFETLCPVTEPSFCWSTKSSNAQTTKILFLHLYLCFFFVVVTSQFLLCSINNWISFTFILKTFLRDSWLCSKKTSHLWHRLFLCFAVWKDLGLSAVHINTGGRLPPSFLIQSYFWCRVSGLNCCYQRC